MSPWWLNFVRWRLIFLDPQNGNCYISPFWRLNFEVAYTFLEKFCTLVLEKLQLPDTHIQTHTHTHRHTHRHTYRHKQTHTDTHTQTHTHTHTQTHTQRHAQRHTKRHTHTNTHTHKTHKRNTRVMHFGLWRSVGWHKVASLMQNLLHPQRRQQGPPKTTTILHSTKSHSRSACPSLSLPQEL
jgi:hypothetical protein